MSLRNKTCLFLVLYCLALYLLFLGNVPLLDPDEPVYGQTAKEMIAAGDWLSPRIYGAYWFDKPPLFYWMEALSFSVFGVSTWSARFPAALTALLTVLYVYLSSRRLCGDKAATASALILATSLEFILLARSSVTDMALTAALTVAMMSFLRKEYVAAYIACGIALLAKGPIGFGFPALIVGLWLLAQNQFRFRPIMALRWYWGIPLACAVGFPWYIYMYLHHGSAFIDTFLGYHNLTRFIAPEHEGKNHLLFYLPVLAAGFFPWCGTLPGLFTRIRRDWKNPVLLYFMIWAAFICVFFSVSSTQLIAYILPMYPPLSLLAGHYLTRAMEEGWHRRLYPACHLFFHGAVAIALAVAPVVPESGVWVRWALAVWILAEGLLSARCFLKGQVLRFYGLQAVAALSLIVTVWTQFSEPVTDSFTSYEIAERLAETPLDPSLPLYIDPFYRPATAFYEDLYGTAMPKLIGTEPIPGAAYVLVQKKLYDKWPSFEKQDWTLIWQTDTGCLFRK